MTRQAARGPAQRLAQIELTDDQNQHQRDTIIMSDRRHLRNHCSPNFPNDATPYIAAVAIHGERLERILAPHVRRHPQSTSDGCSLFAACSCDESTLEREAADAEWERREEASYVSLFDRLDARKGVVG